MRPEADEPVLVRFHSSVYTLKGLRAAAERFGDLARIDIRSGETYHTVVFERRAEDGPALHPLADEFSNHALACTIELKGA
jgi:hypothetical protein